MKYTKIVQLFTAISLTAGFAGAQDINFDRLPSVSEMRARAASIQAPSVPSPSDDRAVKEWTIMVFINGKNNLSGYVEKDMNEMEAVGSTDKVNIVVEAGKMKSSAPSYPDYPGGWDDYYPDYYGGGFPGSHPPPYMYKDAQASAAWDSGVRRFYVTKDNSTSVLGSQTLQVLDKADMGDWNHLVEFAKWAKAAYPARKYMLIVWNHGSGWDKSGEVPLPLTKGISYDDETNNHISTRQLGQALRAMGGVDIYASDACLMQMAEVIYELKDAAPVVVGSEETEPGDGWDYTAFLSRVPAANISSEAMAKAAVEGYAASYGAKNKAVTLSAVYSRDIDTLRYELGLWVVDAMTRNDKASLKAALNDAIEFEGAQSKDLSSFLTIAGNKVPELKARGNAVISLVNRMVIKNGVTGKYQNAGGLGIYLPSWSFDSKYSKLAWSNAGNWDEFMQWMTAKDAEQPASTR